MFNTYLKRITVLTYKKNKKEIIVIVFANLYENEEIVHMRNIENQGFLACLFGVNVNAGIERGVEIQKKLVYEATVQNDWNHPNSSDHITAVFLKHNGNLDSDSMNTEDGYEI